MEGDETLWYVEDALDQGVIAAMTIGRSGDGYQVSVRRDTDGWEVFTGADIADTIARAVMAGPQTSPAPVGNPPAPWQRPLTAMQMANAKIAEIKAEMSVKVTGIDQPIAPTATLCSCMDGPNEPDPHCTICGGTGIVPLTKPWPIGGPAHDNGVAFSFNSEGIEPL